ncbi:MAG: LacI family transcriptional regulator [Spirochaetaceae bacterium]
MRVTIKDIAKIAGVNMSTVSRALNNNPKIKLETRDKIKKIAVEMNFEFNAGARSLSGKKTGNIGVVYETHIGQLGPSLYINQLFIELRHVLERSDLDTIVLEGYHPDTGVSNIRRLISQQKVDAFIIVHDKITAEDYKSMRSAKIPFVQLQLLPSQIEREYIDYFFADNKKGGYIATEHLIKQGCKKILTVLPHDVTYEEYTSRTVGYRKALEDNNLEYNKDYVIPADFSFSVGNKLLNSNSDLIKSADGIFFQTDIQAFAFLTIARERGIKIPEDLKIIGFDDSPICEAITPTLSTIHQPKTELAELACDRIMELISNKKLDSLNQEIVSPTLIVRQSSESKL